MQQSNATVSTIRARFFLERIVFFLSGYLSHVITTLQNRKVSTLIAFGFFLILACVPSAKAEASIQFVGSTTASGTNTAYSMSLTSLTGGIGSAPAQNDIIIVTNTFNGIANGNPGVASVGYTEVADLYVNDTNDVNTSVSYIFATSTPATSVTCNPSANSASSSVCTAMVFRGVDRANPMDVTATTTASVQNNEDINCPVITPVTTGAYVVCAGGAVGASVSAAFATISGYTHQYKQDDVGGAAASVVAYKAWTSGAENPAAFVLNMGTTAQNSWAAVTMALRPAAIYISGTLFSDEGVTAITAPKTIALAVGTGTSPNIYTMTSDTSGNWWFAIGTTTASSTRLLVWVDATSTERASLFTIATTTRGDIGGLSLYKDRVIVSYGTTTSTSTTLADLGFYDSDNDSDIRFNASSTLGTLNVFDGQELHVWTGKTMELTGSSTLTGNVHIATSSRLVGGATTTVVGNFNNTGGYTANGARYWSQVSSGGYFSGITYGNGLFVAVEYSGQVKTSPDGINWTARTVPANAWQSVTYGNGKFVAVADSGTYRVITSSDGITWATTTASSPYSWHGVTYGLGSGTTTPLFVAVGCGQSSCPDGLTSNLVMTSPDGINWTTRAAASSNPWLSVTYGNGKFVAVSWNGTNQVMTSTDGVTWSPQSEPVSSNWRIITYGLGSGTTTPLFVAVGGNGPTGGSIITSPDGISWTNRTMPRDIGVYGVTYGDGLIVAVGYSRYALVSTDGVNWKDFDMGYTDLYYGVGFGNGMFSAVGDNGNVSTSKTLLTMSSTSAQSLSGTLTGTSSLGSVAFTGAGTKTFANNASTTNFTINTGATVVAPAQLGISGTYTNKGTFTNNAGTVYMSDYVTATGTMVGTSAFNNVTITGTSTATFQTNASTSNLTINQGATLVAPASLTVGGNLTQNGTYDTGLGKRWVVGTSTQQTNWAGIAYGNGLFVAVSNNGDYIMTSPDGVTWTGYTAPVSDNWESITYGNGVFVASGYNGNIIRSTDGVSWTNPTTLSTNGSVHVNYVNRRFVAVAQNNAGSPSIYSSSDGITWTPRGTHASYGTYLRSVAYGNGVYIASGYNNDIASSTDGINWTYGNMPAGSYYTYPDWRVAFGNGTFVMKCINCDTYGDNIATSQDGINWIFGYLVLDEVPQFVNGTFIMKSAYPTNEFLTSSDGVRWESQSLPSGGEMGSIAEGAGKLVSVAWSTISQQTMVSDSLLTMSSTSAQSLSGTLTGTSSLGSVAFTGAGTKTFANNASTTNFTINTGATVVAPAQLSMSGAYTNSGTFTAGSGTTTFNGTSAQTATGTMVGTSAFANLVITNTSGNGSSTLQSVRFGASASTTDTLTMLASTSANFKASATSTFQNISLQGSAGQYVFLRSSIPGTRTSFYVPGTVKNASYVDVKDNSACPTTITPTNGVDSGNTLCWTFTAGGGGTSGLTISGILYSDEGITPITTTKTIKIAVGTSTPPTLYSTSTNASGAWSFTFATSSLATSTRIVVWVDADATTRGAFFTKSASTSASITSVPLYQNRVIVSHEATTSTSTTITDLGFYDNDDDTDIQYNATTTSAGLVINAGNELHVLAGKTFAPGGAVTIRGNAGSGTDGSLHLSATSTFQPGGVTSIAGNFTASSSATFTPNFSGIVFNATTTGKTLITPFSLGSTTFSSSGGGWTFATSASTTNLTIKTGATVVAPATTLAINGNYSNSGTFTNNAGTVNLGGSSWDVSQAVYTGKYKSVSAQDGGPQDIAFSPDGTKMYMAGNDNNNLYQYTLSTAWDVTTAVYSTSIASADATPVGITFSPDGTKMFETGWTNGAVYPYALSTPWDLSTAVLGTGRVFPEGIHGAVFSLDGTKMYTENYTNGTVIQYTLPTPWDVSVTTATTTKNISETGLLTGLFLSSDGTKMYVMGYETNQTIFQYALSTPGDVSSAQYTSFSKYVGGEDDFPISFTLSPDGTKMYMVDLSSPYNVYQYDLSAQTATGTMTGTSAFNNVTVTSSSTATFLSNASTTNLTVNAGATVVAPEKLTVGGNLTNNGTYDTAVGKHWSLASAPYEQWHSVAYGNTATTSIFVAVAHGGGVMTSPDGVTWTSRTAAEANQWRSVTFGNGLFVAVADNGTNQVMTSPDGITWTPRSATSATTWEYVIYANGTFVAVARWGEVMTSTNGISWTPRTAAATNQWRSIAYGNGTFVAVADSGTINNRVMISTTSGATWVSRTATAANSWYGVAYGAGLFVAVSADGTNQVMTSPDGTTWTARSASEVSGWYSLTYANGLFVATADTSGTARIMTSPDGITWTTRAVPAIGDWESVAYGGGKFVGVQWNGTGNVMVSDSLLTFSSTSAQTLSGNLTGTSSLGNVVMVGTSSPTSNGLVGYWSLDTSATNWVTGSTGSTTDGSGNGRTGNMTNMSSATSPITGKRGQALTFDGTDDYVTTANTTFVTDYNSNHSQFAWVYPTAYAAGAYQSVVSFGEADDSDWETGIALYDTNGYLIQMTDGWDPEYVDSTLTVPLNQWSFVGFVRTSGQVKFYVNGNSTVIGTGGSGTIGTTDPILIGASGHNASRGGYFDGGIDEVSLYNRALSDNEVASLYSFNAKTFSSNASTTNLTINSGATVVAPAQLSIEGNYANSGTFTAGSGTTTFNGTSAQTATGTMTGTSAFANLVITNTSGSGSSTLQSVTFGASASTTDTLTMLASTSANFQASATSTFQNISLQGSSGSPVYLRSSTNGTRFAFYVSGSQKAVTYVDVKDSSACPTTINVTSGTDSGNTLCWSFTAPGVSLSSASNQTFYYTQSTTTISTMTVTDTPGATVTAVNDIRIRIASTTVNMKWDTTDTTATFGGTASAKVSNPVSFENNGTTLVIPVSNNFSAGDTLTIDGLSFAQFLGVNSATVGLNMYLAGASDAVSDDADDKTIAISGLSTLANHTNGQVTDNINSTTEVGIPLFGFNFNSAGEDATVSSLTVRLKDVNGVVTSDLTNFALYRDNNANGTYEAGDTAVGGTPVVTISGETGTVVFSTSFTATSTAKNYLLIGSVDNVRVTEGFTVSLSATDITMAGVTSGLMTQTGSLTTVRHMKGGGGASAGGSHGAIGGAPPAGDGTRGGGGSGGGSGGVDPDSGTPIGNEDGFNAPSEQGSPQGGWTNGTNVYTSNGVYTTTSGNGARHTYTTFNFNVPLNNTVVGVEVKVEASGSTAAGTVSVGLSWNNGNSLTSLKTTGTLGLTDSVFLLGGPADNWGHSWTPSEMANGSFAIEITGNTSSNTLSIDAIQTKVYHQSSGGGGGGGGAI